MACIKMKGMWVNQQHSVSRAYCKQHSYVAIQFINRNARL